MIIRVSAGKEAGVVKRETPPVQTQFCNERSCWAVLGVVGKPEIIPQCTAKMGAAGGLQQELWACVTEADGDVGRI